MALDKQRNFFELFGFPVGYDLDTAQLAERYRSLQQRVHPDRHAGGSDAERRVSMQMTTLVNEAYQTLRHPVRRARYLLELDGASVDDESDTRMDPVFLAEQMELRESLDEARHEPKPAKRLAEIARDAEQRLTEKIAQFRQAYGRGVAERDRARQTVREMQFLEKLQHEIEELEEGLV